MIRARMLKVVPVLAALCLPGIGRAEVPATAVEISLDPNSQTSATAARCTGFELLSGNSDCTYNQSSVYGGPWAGPVLSDGFYPIGEGREFDGPIPPGNVGVPLSGTLVIDGQGTADCADDTLSGVIEMAPFTRNYFDGPMPGLRQVDDFPGGIVQTIATTPFASGMPNAGGGCDYTLGSQGVPERLFGPGGEYPGMNVTMPQWDFPASVEISRFAATSTPNLGAQAVATIGEGYSCVGLAGACTSTLALAWNQAGKASWNNITGTLSTSAAGDLLQSFLYVVHDNFAIAGLGGGQPVNAFGYTVVLSGSPAPPPPEAVADSAATAQDVPVVIDLLANDQFLQDPVTVTITTPPASGSAVVAGSPGAAEDISATYTPDAGFTGEDVFVYRVETALGVAEATVTVTVLLPGANDDQATTVSSAVASIDVLANDFGFTDPVRLEILLSPDGGGLAEVVDSAGTPVPDGVGAQDDLRVRFVPGPLPFEADSAVERFTYRVTGPVAGPVPRAFRLTRVVIERDLAPTIDSNGSTPNLYNRIDDGVAIVTGKSVRIPGVSFVSILSLVPSLPILDQLWLAYTGVAWTTTLGSGVTATKTDVRCTNGNATPAPCPAPRGLLGDWVTGQLTDGTQSNLSFVDVSLDGDVLTLVRQTEHYDCTGGSPWVPPTGVCPDNNRIRYTFYFTEEEGTVTAALADVIPLQGLAPVSIDVLANDLGFVAPLEVAIVSQPSQGTATVVGSPGTRDDIRILYTPGAGFTGRDSFSYRVDDGTSTGTATVTVAAERQDTAEVAVTVLARGANQDQVSLFDSTPVDIDVLANDQGLQDPVSVAVIAGPITGSAEVRNASGPQSAVRIRYTPAPGFRGIDTLAYAVTDAAGTETGGVGVAVALAQGDLAITPQGQPLEIDVLANDMVLEGPQTVQVISGPANGAAVVIGSPGSAEDIRIVYTPDPGFPAAGARAVDAFTYEFTAGPYAGRAEVRIEVFVDADGDGVVDDVDNCLGVFNPNQLDADGDGFGNRCDADFNNDGVVNFADLALFRGRFGTTQPELDLNGDGVVNFADLAIFRTLFGKPPGPSALTP